MSALRIGIACYPTYGGSGVMATELGLALADRGHDVHLFSYERPMRLPACRHGPSAARSRRWCPDSRC